MILRGPGPLLWIPMGILPAPDMSLDGGKSRGGELFRAAVPRTQLSGRILMDVILLDIFRWTGMFPAHGIAPIGEKVGHGLVENKTKHCNFGVNTGGSH